MSPVFPRLVFWFGLAASAFGASSTRTSFDHSILAVPATADASHPRRGHLVRTALRADEQAASVPFELALRMRNFDELQARLARGEQISSTEMAARYFPTAADESRLVAWATGAGLTVDRTDANHLAVFGHGTVAAASSAFGTTFARVATPDGEFTSAISSPSLPSDLAPAVLGVHGLQPHLRPHILSQRRKPAVTSAATVSPYTPAQIMTAYKAAGLGLTGSGQTIAVFAQAYPLNSDLSSFWSQAGVTGASLSNITQVNIESGPGAAGSTGYADSLTEASLDVEWLTGLAPSAKIRVYGSNYNDDTAFDLTFQQVYADLASNPTMHIFSISFGGGELEVDEDYLVIEAQYFATLASAGVTVLASSGDAGAYEDGVLQVDYPACDPNVTGVGGTTLQLTSTNTIALETAWTGSGNEGSGGGTSYFYQRPSWQTGIGVASGNYRLVPDVAAAANPTYGALVYDSYDGGAETIGGTSWATPIWAAFCAMINQSRAAANSGTLGLLNPRIYPLNLTAAFHDITTGNNGYYVAGTGYDEVTGLGTPVMSSLISANLSATAPLAIAAQLPAAFSVIGQPATFYVVASGPGPFTYQWQREAAGTSTWTALSDNGTFSGTATAMMVITGTTAAMSGDSYSCVVSNGSSSVTSAVTGLTVEPVGVTTLAGWPESAGRGDGTGWAARFDFVGAVFADGNGNVFVADGGGNTVREISASAVVTTIAGTPGTAGWVDGTGSAAQFNDPSGIVEDTNGNLFIADFGDYTIRKVVLATQKVTTFAGTGNQAGMVNSAAPLLAKFEGPAALAIDSSNNLYVADGNTIREITASGVVTTVAGTGSVGSTNGTSALTAEFNNPEGVAVDSSGNIYVSDTGNSTIRVISKSTGLVTTLAGSPGATGARNGTGTAARFNYPGGLRVDSSGNVYVADSYNDTIREITPAGVVTTIAGTSLYPDDVDGVSTNAAFNTPGDLTFGVGGVIYVADSGNYTVRRFVPGSLVAPTFSTQPSSVTIGVGGATSFAVAVASSATPTVTYQWQIETAGTSAWVNLSDGGIYSGSATASLSIYPTSVSLSGNEYRCIAANPVGTATSNAATLTITAAPTFTNTNQSIAVASGNSITLSASATGSGDSYQWYFNGTAISGATGSTYTISSFSSSNAGVYSVTATNTYGSTTATIATLSVGSTRLINLSALSSVSGGSIFSAGFVIGGGSGAQETVLLRGIGPTLSTFGYTSAVADPKLVLFNSSQTQIGENQGWGGTAALSAAFTLTGAFALPVNSADDALLASNLALGSYTTQLTSASGGSGTAMTEIYEANPATTTARLLNVSVLSSVSPGTPLVGGFTIGGTGTEEVLIRADGPTLANFSVSNVLANPVLTVYNNQTQAVIATNTGWTASAATTVAQFDAIFSSVQAFSLNGGSADAAVVLSLSPGTYSAQITGANNTSGQAMIEIYEVSP